jgi:hypothetical protein
MFSPSQPISYIPTTSSRSTLAEEFFTETAKMAGENGWEEMDRVANVSGTSSCGEQAATFGVRTGAGIFVCVRQCESPGTVNGGRA